ncbi:hypothetical protein ElyMa_001081200 [Elysia marginata]|uniref:Uncharacterized protein n=1 Tax=Elysia marginata TaxID=1093978 RepID=A0AAV4HRN2_9GAST|nr:hypothetical protein ElyMa_001081200 [Elysia marginata]
MIERIYCTEPRQTLSSSSHKVSNNNDEKYSDPIDDRKVIYSLRKSQNAITRVAVQWKPEGRRKRGRPKTTWRRTAEAEAATMGQSWGTLRTLAQDREKWRDFVAALVAHGKKGSE